MGPVHEATARSGPASQPASIRCQGPRASGPQSRKPLCRRSSHPCPGGGGRAGGATCGQGLQGRAASVPCRKAGLQVPGVAATRCGGAGRRSTEGEQSGSLAGRPRKQTRRPAGWQGPLPSGFSFPADLPSPPATPPHTDPFESTPTPRSGLPRTFHVPQLEVEGGCSHSFITRCKWQKARAAGPAKAEVWQVPG